MGCAFLSINQTNERGKCYRKNKNFLNFLSSRKGDALLTCYIDVNRKKKL